MFRLLLSGLCRPHRHRNVSRTPSQQRPALPPKSLGSPSFRTDLDTPGPRSRVYRDAGKGLDSTEALYREHPADMAESFQYQKVPQVPQKSHRRNLSRKSRQSLPCAHACSSAFLTDQPPACHIQRPTPITPDTASKRAGGACGVLLASSATSLRGACGIF